MTYQISSTIDEVIDMAARSSSAIDVAAWTDGELAQPVGN